VSKVYDSKKLLLTNLRANGGLNETTLQILDEVEWVPSFQFGGKEGNIAHGSEIDQAR